MAFSQLLIQRSMPGLFGMRDAGQSHFAQSARDAAGHLFGFAQMQGNDRLGWSQLQQLGPDHFPSAHQAYRFFQQNPKLAQMVAHQQPGGRWDGFDCGRLHEMSCGGCDFPPRGPGTPREFSTSNAQALTEASRAEGRKSLDMGDLFRFSRSQDPSVRHAAKNLLRNPEQMEALMGPDGKIPFTALEQASISPQGAWAARGIMEDMRRRGHDLLPSYETIQQRAREGGPFAAAYAAMDADTYRVIEQHDVNGADGISHINNMAWAASL